MNRTQETSSHLTPKNNQEYKQGVEKHPTQTESAAMLSKLYFTQFDFLLFCNHVIFQLASLRFGPSWWLLPWGYTWSSMQSPKGRHNNNLTNVCTIQETVLCLGYSCCVSPSTNPPLDTVHSPTCQQQICLTAGFKLPVTTLKPVK